LEIFPKISGIYIRKIKFSQLFCPPKKKSSKIVPKKSMLATYVARPKENLSHT